MFSSDFALEILPLASVLISFLISCLVLRIPLREGIVFGAVTLFLSLFCLSPVVLLVVAINTLASTSFLPDSFSFAEISSWNNWYQTILFQENGGLSLELSHLLIFSFLSLSAAVYLASTILGWHLHRGVKLTSSVVLISAVISLASISVFGRLWLL